MNGLHELPLSPLTCYCFQTHLRSALRLRGMCCVNGGCFIKVGQHIGSLDYLLPPEYVSTMKVLHKDAPQSPVDDIRRVLRDDLGEEVSKLWERLAPLEIFCDTFSYPCYQNPRGWTKLDFL